MSKNFFDDEDPGLASFQDQDLRVFKAITSDNRLALEFVNTDNYANQTKRELLTTCARTHAGNVEGVKALLEGYANKFVELGFSDSIVRVRKSEANTIFKAYSFILPDMIDHLVICHRK